MSEDQPITPVTPQPDEMSFSERLRLYGGVAIIAVLILFFLQNLHEAEVRFLWFEWETRVIWALLVSAVFGAIATFSMVTIRSRKARRQGVQGQAKESGS